MKRAVTNLKARGDTTFLCLSNSNEVYIGTILEVSCVAVDVCDNIAPLRLSVTEMGREV